MDAAPGPRLALLAAACLLPACTIEENYTNPDGPRYVADHTEGEAAPSDAWLVVSYNLAFGDDVPAAIEALDLAPLADADVILMQEMDELGVEAIAAHHRLSYVYYPASNKHGAHWGNAVLSRWPLSRYHKVLLPWADPFSNTRRIAAAASIDAGGRQVLIYSTHIATPSLGLGARLDQIEAILDDADAAADGDEAPILIGGDLNTADPGSAGQVKELFADRGYAWASRNATDTGSAFGSDATLDYVFARGLDADDSGTYRGDAGSDHQPIWVELRFP